MKFRCKGHLQAGHYVIQVQFEPRTRFAEIGQVWKQGSRWSTGLNADTWPSKKIAIALVQGAYRIQAAAEIKEGIVPGIEEDQAEHARDMPGEGEVWPSWAKWPKGTILKSLKYGDRGPLESAYTHRGSGRQRYAIWLKRSHVRLCGTVKQFEEVNDE